MRFKKGSEVEVMEKGELPFESWRPARIVKGNGHTYAIKYDTCDDDASLIASKVPRKLLRPRPPPFDQRRCTRGDVVEVFKNYSWRLGEILGTLGRGIIVVRLLGSSTEIEVPLFLMRAASAWKDDHWTTSQMQYDQNKNSTLDNKSKGGNLSSQIPPSCLEVLKPGGDYIIRENYETGAYSSGRRSKKIPHALSTNLLARTSKKKKTTTMGRERGSDDVSSTSSVASCSFNNGSHRPAGRKVSRWNEFHCILDDAESFSNARKEPSLMNHSAEFDSYYSTMMSLYESGSLNWEQELLLTNLRLDLHISNDEHLSTVRHLLNARW